MVFGYEEQMDAFSLMQLTDLAQTLAEIPNLSVELEYASFYDDAEPRKISVSQLWTRFTPDQAWAGQLSDIYLRAGGTVHYTDANAVAHYLDKTKHGQFPVLAKQILAAAEDHRLEKKMMQQRPGMKRIFAIREACLKEYFMQRTRQAINNQEFASLFFCYFYIGLKSQFANPWHEILNLKLGERLENINPLCNQILTAETTAKLSKLCLAVINEMEQTECRDTLVRPFDIWPAGARNESINHEEMNNSSKNDYEQNRSNHAKSRRLEGEPGKGSSEGAAFPSWPRETERQESIGLEDESELASQRGQEAFTGREASAAQEMTIVQARAQAQGQETSAADSALPSIKEKVARIKEEASTHIHAHVYTVWLKPKHVSESAVVQYEKYVSSIEGPLRNLTNTMLKTLQFKQDAARDNLMYGRLGKNLLHLVTEDTPKVFYKQNERGRILDAAFSLLVDCSASMIDKMEEAKRGVALFHEALKSLRIPHAVTGFWEEAPLSASDKYPNMFQTVIPFENSLRNGVGPAITSLSPEQDNRDGYAIREMARTLLQRTEKHPFLIVFSDGEPAASDYYEAGVLDTYEAVLEARKQNVDVIGIFLCSDGDVREDDRRLMENIYGHSYMMIPDVSELPTLLAPLLRRLLLKSMQT